jgi:glucose/arabinose dehydrogenase
MFMTNIYKWSLLFLLIIPFLAKALQDNKVDPAAIKLNEGYKIEAIVTGLSVPTTAIFDGEDIIVAESGFLNTAKPRILRITKDGNVTLIAEEGLQSPVTGLLLADGILYVSHKTKVSKINNDGSLTDIVTDLPSLGDHQNNNIVMGKDGRIYLGQGTVTNAGVVGEDNYVFGWLDKNPQIHDVPCYDITLIGKNFETGNPLTEADDKAVTGAYKSFGTPSTPGEVIKGNQKCNGAILSFRPDGTDLKVVAWGLRNPFGLEYDLSGNLWATFHGTDVRGSRNINNDSDYLVKIEQGAWYGWPEYFKNKPATDSSLKAPGAEAPTFLWQSHPPLTKPFAMFDSHSATNGFAFSPSDKFGFKGDAFIAMFGSFTPVTTGPNVELSGFSVVKVNMQNAKIESFASNKIPGPSYINLLGGFNRPSDIIFGPDDSMYVIDWGAATLSTKGLELKPETGVIWRIYNSNTQTFLRPAGPIVVDPARIPKDSREPLARNASETYQMVGKYFLPIGIVILILILIFVAKKKVFRNK